MRPLGFRRCKQSEGALHVGCSLSDELPGAQMNALCILFGELMLLLMHLILRRWTMPSILQRSDYVEFLFRMKFGGGSDPLAACLEQAYLDLRRTLRGIGKPDIFPKAQGARQQADEVLKGMFASIRDAHAATQKDFDEWHRHACGRLAAIYGRHDYTSFHVGQAQKWLNMTFKYIYVMGDHRLSGFGHLYCFCHVPLDNILIAALRPYNFSPLPSKWSELDDYEIYMDRQRWLRTHFSLAPLDVEFLLWIGRPLPTN